MHVLFCVSLFVFLLHFTCARWCGDGTGTGVLWCAGRSSDTRADPVSGKWLCPQFGSYLDLPRSPAMQMNNDSAILRDVRFWRNCKIAVRV